MTKPESPNLRKLVDLVARLRAPDGCPWDRKQTIGDLRAYVIEEAHEVAAAISSGDRDELVGELGDLLFQIVFLAHLGEEEGSFDLDRVIDAIHTKMVDRHPHVFDKAGLGHADPLKDAAAVVESWERRKLTEKDEKGERRSLLAGVPDSVPALVGAYRITQKAAGVGFDWPDAKSVLAKVREELEELEAALEGEGPGSAGVREEAGDLLFAVANLARHLGADPEAALAACNIKFRRRFGAIESALEKQNRNVADATLEEMDALWEQAKQHEKEEKGAA